MAEEFDRCADLYEEGFNLTSALSSITYLMQVAPGIARRQIATTITELTRESSEHGKEVITQLLEVDKMIVEKHKEAGSKMKACVAEHKTKTRAAFLKCATQCIDFKKR